MEKHKPDTISRLASIATSALDTAILELTSGSPEQCLDTLNTLKQLLTQWAGNDSNLSHNKLSHKQYRQNLTIDNTKHIHSAKMSIK